MDTVKHSFPNEYSELKCWKVSLVAFLLKSRTSVRSSLLETPWMSGNSKDRCKGEEAKNRRTLGWKKAREARG